MTEMKVCPVCGTEFPNDSTKRVYCSIECKRLARNAAERRYYAANKKAVSLRRLIRVSKTAEDKQKYTETYRALRKPVEMAKCLHCGTEFPKRHANQKLCSPECAKAYSAERKREWRLRKLEAEKEK